MAERVVVNHVGGTTEFAYSNYKDWNNPLNLIDAMYAGRMIERRNGAVARARGVRLSRTSIRPRHTEAPRHRVLVPLK